MNWQVAIAISEVVAAVGIVTSVVYLAIQVRSSVSTFRTSLVDASYRDIMEWNAHLTSDAELPWLFQRAVMDLAALSDKEKARAAPVLYSFFKMNEKIYLHHLEGHVDEERWRASRLALAMYGAQPGAQQYLQKRMEAFHVKFQEVLRSIDSPSMMPACEAFKEQTQAET